jgi:hypothetical protein
MRCAIAVTKQRSTLGPKLGASSLTLHLAGTEETSLFISKRPLIPSVCGSYPAVTNKM